MENTDLYKYLISDQNIYLAIYSLESYVFDPELLDEKDKELFDRLHDKFNHSLIKDTINEVRKLIVELLIDENKFIYTQVYFKPKKYVDNILECRPLHTTSLISQIALVAMLNILIYEIPNQRNMNKITLSNLSRLLPGNFYGNRVSTIPNELFKSWKIQYKEYTNLANESFKNYHNSLEYKYEVILDLEKFFPSVNPKFLYNYIISKIPVTYSIQERELIKTILVKLLYSKIDNLETNYDIELYYGEDFEKLEFPFCRGIPQGLPQSYFLGNISMIEIATIFNKEFKGKSLFYVDDSVIFTNKVKEDEFKQQLAAINKLIEKKIEEYINIENNDSVFNKYKRNLPKYDYYKIKVHIESGKSSFTKITDASEDEIYLKNISREASQISGDMYALYSDEEVEILKEKTSALVEIIKREISIVKRKSNRSNNEQEKNKLDAYKKKLIRYYKFFKYRMEKFNLQGGLDLIDLSKIIYITKNKKPDIEAFINIFNDDIWGPAVSIYIKNLVNQDEKDKLKNYILELNKLLYKSVNYKTSYVFKYYEEFLDEKKEYYRSCDKYESLMKYTQKALKRFAQKHKEIISSYIQDVIDKRIIEDDNSLLSIENIVPKELVHIVKLVDVNTDEMKRMLLNTIYSYLFSVEVNDKFIIVTNTKKYLSYGELRKLIFVRHSNFTIEMYKKANIRLMDENNCFKMDYSIMEVLDAFKIHINQPLLVDNLIQTHQYTYDVWKNGSKYLYFYTLHNQEHAVDLIKNIIKIVKAIDYIKISSQDYYILFIACYLHDISMVKVPNMDLFLLDNEETDNITYTMINRIHELEYDNELSNVNMIKLLLKDIYMKLDAFYEKHIRDGHANDSANEIRSRNDLNFLDTCLREIVAEVAIAHGYKVEDIYHIKSDASTKLISHKFDKILLRLADLLDMSNYRISRPILNHNLEQMSQTSAFHWISHLLTRGYKIETKYLVNKKSSLKPKTIVEKLVFTIYVDISQLSEIEIDKKCIFVELAVDNIHSDHLILRCGNTCTNEKCNFLCKWFTKKNKYLAEELSALTQYLNRIPDNYFNSVIEIKLEITDKTKLDSQQFEIIKKFITD
nr:reverse transcriptase domain-containing protein [uncultured Anaerocolumna sp.]